MKKDNRSNTAAQQTVEMSEKEIDENIIGSFPASDPPAWPLGLDRDKPKKPKGE